MKVASGAVIKSVVRSLSPPRWIFYPFYPWTWILPPDSDSSLQKWSPITCNYIMLKQSVQSQSVFLPRQTLSVLLLWSKARGFRLISHCSKVSRPPNPKHNLWGFCCFETGFCTYSPGCPQTKMALNSWSLACTQALGLQARDPSLILLCCLSLGSCWIA